MRIVLSTALAFLFLNFIPIADAQTNTVTLTAYYPAPFGAYDRLRLVPRNPDLPVCGAAEHGTLYVPQSSGIIQYCDGANWGPLTGGVFKKISQPAPFDGENPGAIIDQYIPTTAYPNLNSKAPYLGVGTDDPQKPVHIAVKGPDIITALALENTTKSINNGVRISFRGNANIGGFFTQIASIQAQYSENVLLGNRQFSNLIFTILNNATEIEYDVMKINGKYGSVGLNTPNEPTAYLEVANNIQAPAGHDYFMITSNPVGIVHGDILSVLNNGNVGIGQNTPTEKLEVAGNIKANTLILTSDGNLKKDIFPVTNALDKVSRLHGVSFEWKDNPSDQRKHMGVIAQEVEKVFPDAVYGADGDKGVDYPSLIAPLIEAVKELKTNNDVLNKQVQQQSAELRAQQEMIESLQKSLTTQEPALIP